MLSSTRSINKSLGFSTVIIHSDPESNEENAVTEKNRIDGFSISIPASITSAVVLGDCIGSGAFAEVYKATYEGRTIAVKQLTEFDFDVYIDDFRNEGAKLRVLNQDFSLSCIPAFVGYKENRYTDTYQILMELIEGETLDDICHKNKHGHMPILKAAEYLTKITESCAEIANKGIIHCDLKPFNMILNIKGKVILCDWAMAQLCGNQTYVKTKRSLGTAIYMAPEIILENKYSYASEAFALASTIYSFVDVSDPFHHQPNWSSIKIFYAVSRGERSPISKLCPPGYKKLIESGWSQDPSKRPTLQTIHEECKAIFAAQKQK